MKWKYNNLKIVFKLIITSLNLQNCDLFRIRYFDISTQMSGEVSKQFFARTFAS